MCVIKVIIFYLFLQCTLKGSRIILTPCVTSRYSTLRKYIFEMIFLQNIQQK
jgi:hypothetical protein